MADYWDKYIKEQTVPLTKETPKKTTDMFQAPESIEIDDYWSQYTVQAPSRIAPPNESVGEALVNAFKESRKKTGLGLTEPFKVIGKRWADEMPNPYENFKWDSNLNYWENLGQVPRRIKRASEDFKHYTKGAQKAAGHIVALTAGEMMRRGEAAWANGLMELFYDRDALGAFSGAMRGLAGEEYGELGDLSRRVLTDKGVPWWATEGIAGVQGLASLGAIAKFMGWIKGKVPKFMGSKWKLRQAQDAKEAVDIGIAREQVKYNKVYAAKSAKPGADTVDDILVSSKTVKEYAKKADVPKIIKDKFMPTKGKLKVKIKDIRSWKTKINKQIGEGAWVKTRKGDLVPVSKSDLIKAERTLKQMLLDNVDDSAKKTIEKIDPIWTQYMRKGKKLQSLVYDFKTDSYRTEPILRIFSDPMKAARRDMLKNLTKYSKEFGQTYRNLRGFYIRRQIYKKGGPIAGATALAGGVGYGGYLGIKALGNIINP